MKRAAVIIGVDKTGGLPKLKDASKGAGKMEAWAVGQGIDTIKVFTDEGGKPVDVSDIKKAIKAIVNAGTFEQLIVYFAGHGVNIRFGEYWLLSDAPHDTQAAVNVQGSSVLARYSGIPHVVFISDACRTAAEGVQAQFVTGSEIFPNDSPGDLEKPVDQFFACTLGRPSNEVKDPDITSEEFEALYTSELIPALNGNHPEIVEPIVQIVGRKKNFGVIRPRPLKAYMLSAVTRRIDNLKLKTKLIQVPDARITSDDNQWISFLEMKNVNSLQSISDNVGMLLRGSGSTGSIATSTVLPITTATLSTKLVESALAQDKTNLSDEFEYARNADLIGAKDFIKSIEQVSKPFGPMNHESGCGFEIRGSKFIEAFSRHAKTELFEVPGTVVRINSVDYPGESVLLILENKRGVVLPAIPGYLAALTVEDGELVDVAYEPSENSERWEEFNQRATEIRTLRAIASSSISRGVFQLEEYNALEIAKRMQYLKGVDPTLAVYAAYAYNDMQRVDLIQSMANYMMDDLGALLFDVALLSRNFDGETVTANTNTLSFVPLLSQGWALLSAHRISLPSSLSELHRSLVSSTWSMFNEGGIKQLRDIIHSEDVT